MEVGKPLVPDIKSKVAAIALRAHKTRKLKTFICSRITIYL